MSVGLLPFQASAALPGVRHVVVIGCDGMSPRGVIKANTPNMRKLMQEGAYTMHARGVMPTSSSPNWASMIMGAGPEQHGVTSNEWETNKFEIPPICTGIGVMFPTIFGVLREQSPNAIIACFHDWDGFGRLLEPQAPNVLKHVKDAIETSATAIKYFKSDKPDFMFVHFDSVDHAGHGFGWDTDTYSKAVEMVDSLIGEIIQAIKESGEGDSTILLVTADHGGKGTSHGGPTIGELEIPWILHGPNVAKGKELKLPVNTYDTAATLAFIFQIKPPACWIAKPIKEAFNIPATQP